MSDLETIKKRLRAKIIPKARKVSPAQRRLILAQAGKPTMPPAVPEHTEPETLPEADE